MRKIVIFLLVLSILFQMPVFAQQINDLPKFPDISQKHYVVYREGSRNNRIEVAFFDIKNENEDDCLVWDDSLQLYDNSKYTNSVKYYLDGEVWALFERGYHAISNYPSEVIATDLNIVRIPCYADDNKDIEIIPKKRNDYTIRSMSWTGKHYVGRYDYALTLDGINVDGKIEIFDDKYPWGIKTLVPIEDKMIAFKNCTAMSMNPWRNGYTYGTFNNSPTIIFDQDFNIIAEKEHNGYCSHMCTLNGRVYIHKEDYSQIDYSDLTVLSGEEFDAKVIHSYYYTENGVDWSEITKEEAEIAEEQAKRQAPNYFGYSLLEIDGQKYLCPERDTSVLYPIVYELPEMNEIVIKQDLDNLYNCYFYGVPFGEMHESNGNGPYGRTVCFVTLDGVYGVNVPELLTKPELWCTEEYMYVDNQTEYYKIPMSHFTENIFVILNGKVLGFTNPPVVENDRTLVPMRFLFEQMGDTVTWDDATMTATASNGINTVTFGIDNCDATVNGATQTMDVPARLINDKTYVPLRFLSENLGYTVTWDEATRTASIITK